MSKTVIYVHSVEDMPKQDHWAIIDYSSIYVPGDEQSRTNPGHGYPGGTERIVLYLAYLNHAEWEADVKKRTIDRNIFTAMYVNLAKITKKVVVEVNV